MTKASDNEFPKLIFAMQTSAPAAPSDSDWKMYAKANGVFARSSNSEVGPFGAGTTVTGGEVFITSDVTMTNANQFYDGPSQSLSAGTYLIWGTICVENPNSGTFATAKLWDGTNVFHAPDAYMTTAGGPVAIPVTAYIVLGSTTTVKISAACNQASGIINDVAQTNGTADKATKMVWLKIA